MCTISFMKMFYSEEVGESDMSTFLCEYNLSNLVKESICFKNSTNLYLILTNDPKHIHNTKTVTIGLSNCHKMVMILFNTFFKSKPESKFDND